MENIKKYIKISKNKLLLPFTITLLGSVIVIVTLFLPYASAKGEYREYLEKYPQISYSKEANMSNEEAMDISLFEFAQIYYAGSNTAAYKTLSEICLIVILGLALFSVLTLLFSVLKKPILILIFNALAFGSFSVLKWDFEDRGVLPSYNYDWGVACFIYYIGAGLVLIGAIILLLSKIKAKRTKK